MRTIFHSIYLFLFQVVQVILLFGILVQDSEAFFFKRPRLNRPNYPPRPIYKKPSPSEPSTNTIVHVEDGYGSPSAPVISDHDSYGSPAAPVVSSSTSYQEPSQSYDAAPAAPAYGAPETSYSEPQSSYASASGDQEDSYGIPSAPAYSAPESSYSAEEDGYGSPAAPVVSYQEPQPSYGSPSKPTYSVPQEQPTYSQPSSEPEKDSYGIPSTPVQTSYEEPQQTYSQPTYEVPEEDSYGAPAAPLITYQEPQQSYDAAPRPSRDSAFDEEIDGYGSPVAPVISYTPQEQPSSYRPPPPLPTRYRPKRKPYFKRYPMNYVRKPKRHIPKMNTKPLHHMMQMLKMPVLGFMFRKPRFTMPKPRLPSFNTIRPVSLFPGKKVKPEVEPSYKPKHNPKLEYSGWTPIESAYSPEVPAYKGPEPEIITVDNAHQHGQSEYSPPAPEYEGPAPEPITVKPGVYDAPEVVYGTTNQYPATYEVQESAPIEEPIFEYGAPIQDLNSLAGVSHDEEYHPQNNHYQSTHQASNLAQDVHSGSVYVQSEPEEVDEDLFYIFYDKPSHQAQSQRPYHYASPTPSQGGYTSGGGASSASFSLHVNGQSHGFGHSIDHRS